MPKSYKICILKNINFEKFSATPYYLDEQLHLEQVDRPPSTSIAVANDKISLDNFKKYNIEHEVEEHVFGRISGKAFTAYIRKGFIDSFVNEELQIALLSGKKRDVLDFCRKKKSDDFQINTITIDMKKLLELLSNVKGVWFSFEKGQLSASALMGSHVEGTQDFKHFQKIGEISTLTFNYERDEALHPIMITEDGTIVLQANYREKTDEVSLVMDIKTKLVDQIYEEVIKKPKKAGRVK